MLDWQTWSSSRGYHMACGDIRVIDEVHAEIRGRTGAGELDPAIVAFLARMTYLDDGATQAARVLLVAVPRPIFALRFDAPRGAITVLLPANYGSEVELPRRLARELGELVGPDHRVAPLRAPFKALATRLGLARYGRNNLAFVEGLGTALQLEGFITDAPLEPVTASADHPTALELCGVCRACVKACPTGAIADDRFLIHAERCISLHLETAGALPHDLPVPEPACLLGCLHCQLACPENRGYLRTEPRASFDAEETRALLGGTEAPPGLEAKLRALDLDGYGAELLGRNLRWIEGALAGA